nr:immunoglobulin light chain junction region [Macaca mulatta]MOV95128.1 immunoglobulin light chain junction region [Macaca mulatta]MOV95457.1 immunoglobulin light chain junction region [Macaca mulatta]MOV96431.1 immunoglobulin light chain junction region [Macaca mulatta]MOV96471.1 immunoglobulin light chain junction region [Macaca mulatta]
DYYCYSGDGNNGLF